MQYLALLRGINVAGHKKVPMAELRRLAEKQGWESVRTYIQTGNLFFQAGDKDLQGLEARLEAALEEHFGFSISVLIREATTWRTLQEQNPFPQESVSEPRFVLLALAKEPLPEGVEESLQAKASQGETVRRTGEALWIHFPRGSGRSKLTPAVMDRLAGSPVTTRNWRTVLKLNELFQAGSRDRFGDSA